MILRIAQKEWITLTRDGRFRALAFTFAVLGLTSAVYGFQVAAAQARDKQESSQTDRRQWLNQERKHPHRAAHFGFYFQRPAMPMSAIEPGIEPYFGTTVWLEAHKQNNFKYRPIEFSGSARRFGDPSPAWLMMCLGPLFIILLCFPSFAQEREQGTLKQAMSQGVNPVQILLGKLLGIGGSLGMLAIPLALLGLAAVMWLTPSDMRLDSSLRFAVYALGAALYLAGFLFLGLACSARFSQRTALFLLLSFWILNAMLMPRLAGAVARRMSPLPNAAEFARIVRADMPPPHSSEEKAKLIDRTLKEYGVKRPEDLPFSFSGLSLIQGELRDYQTFDKFYSALYGKFDAQERVHLAFGVLFPAMAFEQYGAGIAGTGMQVQRDFAFQAESYRRRAIQTLNEDVYYNGPKGDWDPDYRAGNDLWAKVEEFKYQPPGFRSALSRHLNGLGVLAAWSLLTMLLALWCVRGLRVV